jgi:hypothetical protein
MDKKTKIIIASLAAALLLTIGLSIALNNRKNHLETALLESEGVRAYLMDYTRELSDQLDQAHADYGRLTQEYQQLEENKNQIVTERDAIKARGELFLAQKYYLADVLDWLGTRYGYADIEQMARAYGLSTGTEMPRNCEVVTYDRYLRWASTQSKMFVVTPEKMGWTPFTSIRENVVFGSDHNDKPGYVGSRGYEFRYPLVVGTYPWQEVHTTLNVFEFEVEKREQNPDQVISTVELDCGVHGYVYVSDDDAQTTRMEFVLGDFSGNVKLKYDYQDIDQTIALLTQAANVVIRELTSGW